MHAEGEREKKEPAAGAGEREELRRDQKEGNKKGVWKAARLTQTKKATAAHVAAVADAAMKRRDDQRKKNACEEGGEKQKKKRGEKKTECQNELE